VIAENIGGGFGMKGGLYPEICPGGARRAAHRPPGEWIADRSEGMQSDEHGRDNVTEAELALDENGRFLALAVRNYANIGAYYNSDRNAGPPTTISACSPAPM